MDRDLDRVLYRQAMEMLDRAANELDGAERMALVDRTLALYRRARRVNGAAAEESG